MATALVRAEPRARVGLQGAGVRVRGRVGGHRGSGHCPQARFASMRGAMLPSYHPYQVRATPLRWGARNEHALLSAPLDCGWETLALLCEEAPEQLLQPTLLASLLRYLQHGRAPHKVSPLISPTPPLYLVYISPTSPLHRTRSARACCCCARCAPRRCRCRAPSSGAPSARSSRRCSAWLGLG